jgi:SAM-dependent methyltransferase
MNQTGGRLDELQRLYASSSEAVRGSGMHELNALEYYSTYVDFVARSSGRSTGRLLDIGCGNAWSSYTFAIRGFETTGVDLNRQAFEPPVFRSRLTLREGSVLSLPFEDASFDLVASYQMLEHVPDPELALREMLRVVRPGGTVTIVSPNLLSVLSSLRGIAVYVWGNRPLKTILIRSPGMPRHPTGNTLPELVGALFVNGARLGKKLLTNHPVFSMREPDLRPPFHADNDACYLCNPIDLIRFFRSQDCRILRNGQYGRPPLTWLAASGTYVTVQRSVSPS